MSSSDHNQKKKKRKKRHRKLWFFLRLQFVLIGLVAAGLIYYYGGGYAKKVSALHSEAVDFVRKSDASTFRRDETSVAYDANGTVLSILKGEQDRYYVTYDEIPQYAKDAAVSIEDKKFWTHKGVDYRAIVRAVWAMIRNGKVTQGASTITQQLARNVFLNQDRTWERKIEEIYIAVELEKKYSKNQILEFYLNNIYYGNGYYGIEAAARGYFNKGISDLTVSEIAFLTGIPNNPSYYDPVEHMDHALSRRDRILENMLDDGRISQRTWFTAQSESIVLERPAGVRNNYAETYTSYCATRALMRASGFTFRTSFESEDDRKSYKEAYDVAYNDCNRKLFTGGYRIYTSIDLNTQAMLQNAIDNGLSGYQETGDDGVYTLQGAAVTIDNATGMVRAIVGGRTQDLTGYTLNRAFQSFRQPGSTIKPLIVYTPALERGYTADTIVHDVPIEDGPSNADGRYLGSMTLQRAVALSRNTVAWSIFSEITPKKGIEYLTNMGFSRIDSSDEVMAASIGGLHTGVSALDMAMGYAAIENDGARREPTCISKITDSEGNVLWQNDQEATVIYQKNAAREMTQILTTVMTEGTARGKGLGDMPSAGKTGTTNDTKDSWFVGYTPYYTTSVWIGYDTPKTLNGLSSATYPVNIWQGYMTSLHEGLPPVQFLTPTALIGDGTGSTDAGTGTGTTAAAGTAGTGNTTDTGAAAGTDNATGQDNTTDAAAPAGN